MSIAISTLIITFSLSLNLIYHIYLPLFFINYTTMTFSSKNTTSNNNSLPESLQSSILVSYRSAGLGLYGALIRFAGMPLEKIALFMNSSQVSGGNQLRQAIHLTFQNGSKRSFFTPYKVVGGTSVVAWFLQYSVMGEYLLIDILLR